MGLFSSLGRMLTRWFVVAALMAALGVAAGLLIFVFVFPGQPKIGVIDVPFTVITEDSSYVISEYLNYARRDDSIKAVVIKITSPGGAPPPVNGSIERRASCGRKSPWCW